MLSIAGSWIPCWIVCQVDWNIYMARNKPAIFTKKASNHRSCLKSTITFWIENCLLFFSFLPTVDGDFTDVSHCARFKTEALTTFTDYDIDSSDDPGQRQQSKIFLLATIWFSVLFSLELDFPLSSNWPAFLKRPPHGSFLCDSFQYWTSNCLLRSGEPSE